jgi:hypothetical protein
MQAASRTICTLPLRWTGAASQFFELQAVVTDAAWTLSAGEDAARLDAL